MKIEEGQHLDKNDDVTNDMTLLETSDDNLNVSSDEEREQDL